MKLPLPGTALAHEQRAKVTHVGTLLTHSSHCKRETYKALLCTKLLVFASADPPEALKKQVLFYFFSPFLKFLSWFAGNILDDLSWLPFDVD